MVYAQPSPPKIELFYDNNTRELVVNINNTAPVKVKVSGEIEMPGEEAKEIDETIPALTSIQLRRTTPVPTRGNASFRGNFSLTINGDRRHSLPDLTTTLPGLEPQQEITPAPKMPEFKGGNLLLLLAIAMWLTKRRR